MKVKIQDSRCLQDEMISRHDLFPFSGILGVSANLFVADTRTVQSAVFFSFVSLFIWSERAQEDCRSLVGAR